MFKKWKFLTILSILTVCMDVYRYVYVHLLFKNRNGLEKYIYLFLYVSNEAVTSPCQYLEMYILLHIVLIFKLMRPEKGLSSDRALS